MARQMVGKLQALGTKLEQHKQENEEFIIMHSGLSRYRPLRAFLIESEPKSQVFVYDIIVPRKVVQTTQRRKEESIAKLKADLNALSEGEKEELKQDMIRNTDFLNNPFFYADVPDLLVDLNFKHYLQTVFNVVLNASSSTITSFSEVEPEEEEIFVAGNATATVVNTEMIKRIVNNKKLSSVFYTEYQHILDLPTAVPLHLENFSETKEFFEGLDPVIQQKTKVSPIKAHAAPETASTVDAGPHFKFAKSLNRNPLRCKSPSKILAVLPSLPQRYVIDKRNFKIPTLRHVLFLCYIQLGPIAVQRRVQVSHPRESAGFGAGPGRRAQS